MTRFLPAILLLAASGAAANAQPPAPQPVREVWVADEAGGSPQRALTLRLRDAIAALPPSETMPRVSRRHRPHTPPVVPSAPAPRILYLADDVRLDRGHRHFRYTALLTDRGFRTTTPIHGRCRVDGVPACARAIVAHLPA